jgi:hypothetical protein
VTGLSVSVSNTYVDSIGFIHVVGSVHNTGTATYKFVQPIVALYAADGTVLRVDWTFSNPDTLGPSGVGTFDIVVNGNGVTYSSYRTWVEADLSNTPPPTSGLTVRKTSSYVDSIGARHVVGEVVNSLGQAAEFVQITVNYYAGSTLVATDTTFSSLSVIPAGGDSPFEVLTYPGPAGVTSFEASVTSFTAPPGGGRHPITGLSVAVSNTYTDVIGYLHVVGTVTNNSGATYTYVQPLIALYSAAGTVVRADFTFTDPSTLSPGQTGAFEFLINASGLSYSSYRTWVDASP